LEKSGLLVARLETGKQSFLKFYVEWHVCKPHLLYLDNKAALS